MAENNNPASEPLQKGAQAANAVRGAVKTGKAIAAAAKGASAGGLYGAIAAFAWENRGLILKIIIAATAVFLIPVIIICMSITLVRTQQTRSLLTQRAMRPKQSVSNTNTRLQEL